MRTGRLDPFADPLMASAGRSHPAYIRACKRLRVEAPSVCCYCGGAIDQTLHHNDPQAWTADHIVPLSECAELGVDPNDIANLRPAHRSCNSRAGALLRQGIGSSKIEVISSRTWH